MAACAPLAPSPLLLKVSGPAPGHFLLSPPAVKYPCFRVVRTDRDFTNVQVLQECGVPRLPPALLIAAAASSTSAATAAGPAATPASPTLAAAASAAFASPAFTLVLVAASAVGTAVLLITICIWCRWRGGRMWRLGLRGRCSRSRPRADPAAVHAAAHATLLTTSIPPCLSFAGVHSASSRRLIAAFNSFVRSARSAAQDAEGVAAGDGASLAAWAGGVAVRGWPDAPRGLSHLPPRSASITIACETLRSHVYHNAPLLTPSTAPSRPVDTVSRPHSESQPPSPTQPPPPPPLSGSGHGTPEKWGTPQSEGFFSCPGSASDQSEHSWATASSVISAFQRD